MKFAIYVVGISSGVRIWELEKYINPGRNDEKSLPIELDTHRWILELYRTIIEALRGVAWLFFFFFVVALIAYLFWFEFLS